MSVYKRKGHWHFRKRIDGVRYRGALKTARTKAEAEADEEKIRVQIRAGQYGKPSRSKNLKEFVEKVYIPTAKESGKKSLRIDRSRLKPILAFFGRKRMPEINTFMIEQYKKQRRETPIVYRSKKGKETSRKPRSAAAVNRELWLLSAILSLALSKGEISKNPFLGGRKRREVQPLKGELERVRYLLPDEETRLLPVLTGERTHLRPMVELFINTGLRSAELLGLRSDSHQLDFNLGVIHLEGAETEAGDGTKNSKSRYVPMNDRAFEILTELVAQARAKGYEFLFTNPDTGKPYTTIKTAWNTACRLAGIDGLRIHDLRHTFGTRAASDNVPLTALRDVMGHGTIEMTMRYAHATDEGKRRVVEAVGKKNSQSKKVDTKWTQRKVVGE